MIRRDGWWLPHAHDLPDALDTLGPGVREALTWHDGRRVAVQAGGHYGAMAYLLAQHYERVHTFEPENANWTCLQMNVCDDPKIEIHREALGREREVGLIGIDGKDSNGHSVETEVRHNDALALGLRRAGEHRAHAERLAAKTRDGVRSRPGQMAQWCHLMPLDELELEHVDALFLDVSNDLLDVLKGARATIAASAPLIVLDAPGDGWPSRFLEAFGYRERARADGQAVYTVDIASWLRAVA